MTFSLVSATRIANRVVDPSFQLRDRYREELEKLDSPQKWVLVREVSRLVEEYSGKYSPSSGGGVSARTRLALELSLQLYTIPALGSPHHSIFF